MCSGKIYYDLVEAREKFKNNNVTFVRIEQLYPFPVKTLARDLKRFRKSLKQHNFKKIIYKSALHSDMNSLINLKPSRVIKGKAFKYNIFSVNQENK